MAKKNKALNLTPEIKEAVLKNSKEKTATKWVSIGYVKTNEFNKNKMGEAYFKALKRNMANPAVAFTDPIKVRLNPDKSKDAPPYEIIDGEHRFLAAMELGYTEIPIFCRGEVTDQQLIYEMIEANQVRGQTSDADLKQMIQELEKQDDKFIQDMMKETTLWDGLAVGKPIDGDMDKYAFSEDDIEDEDRKAETHQVSLFFNNDQLDIYRRIVGQLRKSHGYTAECAVMEIFEHFQSVSGFGEKTGDEQLDMATEDLYDEDDE